MRDLRAVFSATVVVTAAVALSPTSLAQTVRSITDDAAWLYSSENPGDGGAFVQLTASAEGAFRPDISTVDLGPVACLDHDSTETRAVVPLQPAPGQAFVDVHRGSQGTLDPPGSWGADSAAHERASAACD